MSIEYHNPEEHILTHLDNGDWRCSCGHWGWKAISVGNGPRQVSVENVQEWHKSHANAIVVQLDS